MVKKITKKSQKVVQIKQKPIKPFSLDGKDDRRVREALVTFQTTEGWALMVQVLETQVKIIDAQIIDKEDLDGKPLTELDLDRLRDRRKIYKEVIDTPGSILEKNQRFDPKPDGMDPYDSIDTLYRGSPPGR